LANIIDSIYLPRGSSEEKRQAALAAIKDRQDLIESTGEYTTLLIFPEGGTTNGSGLIKFKKGAFFAEKTVRPVMMKYNLTGTVSPAYDTIELLPLAIL
jgi:1-acyl-sn-glycerol-3-phosphate acyltransferase